MDLGDHEGTIRQLQAEHQRRDHTGYKKREPWTPGMLNAWKRYHALALDVSATRRAFHQYAFNQSRTCEFHLKRAGLAIAWGEATVRYVDLILLIDAWAANQTYC